MDMRERTGFYSYGAEELAPECREGFLASRGPGDGEPLLLSPAALDVLVDDLLAGAPTLAGPRRTRLRRELLLGASVFETADGGTALVLSEPAERFVRKTIAAFEEEDRADLLALGSEVDAAAWALAADGRVDSLPAAEACDRAAAALEAFLAKPRRALGRGLGDFAQSVAGIEALANLIELLRRLLIGAGRANDALGDATIGGHDLQGVDDAVRLRKASDCPAAKSLAKGFLLMLSRTEGLAGLAPAEVPPSTPEGTAWIEACSRIGQQALRWAYDQSGASLNFAGQVGDLWPGPALYGYGDWEASPGAARELCDAFGRGGDGGPCAPMLCGTYEATVSEDLAVPVPEALLKGATRLYVTEREAEPGFFFCQAAPLRMGELARLIEAEQALDGYPWEYADDFEEEFGLYAFGDEVEVVGGMLPLQETSLTPDWARPGAEVVLLGAVDHFEIAAAGPHAQSVSEWEDEISGLLELQLE